MTDSSGTVAMSFWMCVVTPSNKLAEMNAHKSQAVRVRQASCRPRQCVDISARVRPGG